jgi:hypothetical protein
MNVRTVAAIVALLAVAPPTLACEDGLSIQEISSGGSIIILDDGSVWEMTAGDASGWSDGDDVVVCGNEIINTSENEKLDAHRLR